MKKTKFTVGIGLILSMLTACSFSSAKEEDPVPSAKAESLYAEAGEMTPEIVLTILEEEDWSEFGTFDFVEEYDAFAFAFTDPDMLEFLEMLPDEPSLLAEWYGITSSFDELGSTIEGLLGSGYSIFIEDPADPEDALYASTDGEMFHDFMAE